MRMDVDVDGWGAEGSVVGAECMVQQAVDEQWSQEAAQLMGLFKGEGSTGESQNGAHCKASHYSIRTCSPLWERQQ